MLTEFHFRNLSNLFMTQRKNSMWLVAACDYQERRLSFKTTGWSGSFIRVLVATIFASQSFRSIGIGV